MIAAFLMTAGATEIRVPTDEPSLSNALSTLSGQTGPHTIVIETGHIDNDEVQIDGSVFGERLTIRGEDPQQPPLLRANNGQDGFFSLLEGALVHVLDVRVDGTNSSRGFLVVDDSTLILDRVGVFNTQSTTTGGAIQVGAGTVLVRESSFGPSVANTDGGHIFADDDGVVLLANEFSGGTSGGQGGSICLKGSGTTQVTANIFNTNVAQGNRGGGALYLENKTTLVSFNTFTDNQATTVGGDRGGGAIISRGGGAHPNIVFNLFCHNSTASDGGAVYVHEDEATLTHNIFHENGGSTPAFGGGIHIRSNAANVTIRHNTLVNNTGNVGMAVYSEEAATFDDNLVMGHTASATPSVNFITSPSSYAMNAFYGNSVTAIPIPGSNNLDDADVPAPGIPILCDPDAYIPAPGAAILGAAQNGQDIGAVQDNDTDGVYTPTDCNDGDDSVNPAAEEICGDGIDQDCDGLDGSVGVVYADGDGDGYGIGPAVIGCVEDGFAPFSGDCDDVLPLVYPGAPELCDGLDNDCDTFIDDGAMLMDWYLDLDLDGFGDDDFVMQACTQPDLHEMVGGDCDDADITSYPGADELCDAIDHNCDGSPDQDAVDTTTFWPDIDGDSFGAGPGVDACDPPQDFVADDTDCDNFDDTSFPGGTEVCDGADNNCNGSTDEAATDASSWYPDADNDLHGEQGGMVVLSCTQPAGFRSSSDDCNDDDTNVHPGAAEQCNGLDDNCDGQVDESISDSNWYADADGDGFGTGTAVVDCAAPADHVSADGDCDDNEPAMNPGEQEVCTDNLDNDCNGFVNDNAVDGVLYFPDDDEDDVGGLIGVVACDQPPGWLLNTGDCDDQESAVNPNTPESCDGLDNDCNTAVDDNAFDATPWYTDADGDGWGDASSFVDASCAMIPGTSSTIDDCDDDNPAVNPGQDEVCDGLDNNCSGMVDLADPALPAGSSVTWYVDDDDDGFGTTPTLESCSPPAGHSLVGEDCNDADPLINPAGTETCDGIDEDCDGVVDEGVSTEGFVDLDGDEFGVGAAQPFCHDDPDWAESDGDCNDQAPEIYPGAPDPEGDGIDQNCDGSTSSEGDGTVLARTGCGCDTPGTPRHHWLLWVGALAWRRRSL